MSELLLSSLEIQNFRAFRHLTVAQLSRVNLIVGKNNVGKTSLLEALHVYAHQGALAALWDVVEGREEGQRPAIRETEAVKGLEDQINALSHLFYGRKELETYPASIHIGPVDQGEDRLSIGVAFRQFSEDKEHSNSPRVLTGLIVRRGTAPQVAYHFDQTTLWLREAVKGYPSEFVLSDGVHPERLGQLWDSITLTDKEDDVLKALQVLLPEVERINLRTENNRTAFVRLRNASTPIRLRSMGEGMSRVFGTALALVNVSNGMLFIDEIENGLHYSIQYDVWRLIFEVAQRLNIQVFATTHSSDCVRAFQQAASEHAEDGVLIRLGRKNGEVVATLFDEEELEIAVSEQIEVR